MAFHRRQIMTKRVATFSGLVILSLAAIGCARLPYNTMIVEEHERLSVTLQHEVSPTGYTHPAPVSAADVAAMLRGFSVRPQQTLPLRWYAEEDQPKPLLREDEIRLLAPALSQALQRVGPDERVRFEVRAPGLNPATSRDVTAGWVAVREPYFYLTVEQVHAQIPLRKSDQYDYNFPTPPPLPGSFLLYFEPGRYWVIDRSGSTRGLDYRAFLKSAIVPAGGAAR
jgi:hypothetical protein